MRILERESYEKEAIFVGYLGYSWMAFIFLFFSSSVIFDLSIVVFGILQKRRIFSIPRLEFLVPLFFSLVLVIYGFFEAKEVKIERLVLKTEKLPKDTISVRIVQISDLHLGIMTKDRDLEECLKKINHLKPDILVATGDIVDGHPDKINRFVESFLSIKPTYGKFAVTGNHEYYIGLDGAKVFFEKAGFKLLANESERIRNGISIVGIDDLYSSAGLERALLENLNPNDFKILIKHRPIVIEDCVGLFDIQLSGHTHGGQIFPFSLITRAFFKHISGHKILGRGSHLYVSRGLGTWGPPIRFLAPPEITVIDLEKTS
ncbi:MAG: metallophosphoesterase [Desulfobacterota bacterium]|nr:metallophosphoesterase [Thermodesulfobacteriota bacterium]